MADAKRQLILDLLARYSGSDQTKKMSDDLDDVADSADKASKSTDNLGKSEQELGGKTEDLGKKTRSTEDSIKSLESEIKNTEAELGNLSKAYADAGETGANRMDISKSIRSTQTELRKLNSNKSVLEGLLPDPEPEAKKWGSEFSQTITTSIKDAASSSLMGTAGVVMGTVLAPEIGSLVAAAVLGGVGIGGIIGGIALAAKSDKDISTYATQIGHTFLTGIQAEAKDAFAGPVMDSLNVLSAMVNRSIPKIGKIFQNLAPDVAVFSDAVSNVGDEILDSLVGASGKAGPVLDALARTVENVGIQFSSFIDMTSSHGEEAASAIDDLDSALTNAMEAFTNFVNGLADIKHGLDELDGEIDKGRYWLEDQVSWLDLTADGYKKGSDAANLYREGVIGINGSANDYNHLMAGGVDATDSFTKHLTDNEKAAQGDRAALTDLSNTMKAQTDPAFALLTAQEGVTKAQNDLSTATQKYGAKSTQARDAARALADAAIQLQGAAGGLSSSFNGKLSPAMMKTLSAAGLTKKQIAAVAEEFARAKAAGDAYAKTYKAEIITDYTYNVGGNDYNREANRATLGQRASGGPVSRGVPYVVGENGPEVIVPDASGRVLSAAASRGMWSKGVAAGSQTRGMGNGRATTVQLEVVGDQAAATFLKKMIRTYNVLETS